MKAKEGVIGPQGTEFPLPYALQASQGSETLLENGPAKSDQMAVLLKPTGQSVFEGP